MASIAAPYLAVLLLAARFGLPRWVIWSASAVVIAVIATWWLRFGRPRTGWWALALGLPLHLIMIASGGLSSPALPITFLWLILMARLWPRPRILVLGVVTLAWLVLNQLWLGELQVATLFEAALVCLGGTIVVWALDRPRHSGPAYDHELPQLSAGNSKAPGDGISGDDISGEVQRAEELAAALDRIRRSLGGWRAVLWEVDVERDRAWPRLVSGGTWPTAVPLTGDPLSLAWEDNLILRLETPPRWAVGSSRTCIVPLSQPEEYDVLLTIEYTSNQLFPATQLLEETAASLRALLDMQREAARAAAARQHFSKIVTLLRRLPQETDPTGFAVGLAEAMRDFAGMTGAAVARWDQDVGHLLACIGKDGGMPPGTTFNKLESEMALAASNVMTLQRQRELGRREPLPIIAPGERWLVEPRVSLTIPLYGTSTGLVGVLSLWSTEPGEIGADQIEVIELVAPFAAIQMYQMHVYGPLQKLADHDALTGLYNRRVFDKRMRREEDHFLRYRRPTSLLIIDVDHFKTINDTFGHAAGDIVLKSLASLLRSTVRGADLVARLGGEEFVVLLPETPLAGAIEIAERLRRQVEMMIIEWQNTPIEISISIGVAAAPECASSPEELLIAADAALYASKRAGRNRVSAAPFAAHTTDDPRMSRG